MAADTQERGVVGFLTGSVFGTFVGGFFVTRNRLNTNLDISKPYSKAEQLVVGSCSIVFGVMVACAAVVLGEN